MTTPRSIQRARTLRRTMTEAETLLWSRLGAKQLTGLAFRRQEPIGPYIADFVCWQARLVIEVDGGQHSDNPSDAERTALLESEGFRVLRFWNNDVLGNLAGVLESIAGAAPPPHPTLSLQGEGRPVLHKRHRQRRT